jgi:hypothetical protein
VHHRPIGETERQQAARAQAVAAVVQRPEAVLAVDADGKQVVEGARFVASGLEAEAGEGAHLAVDQLDQFPRRARFRVQGDKDPSLGTHRDIPWRRGQFGDGFQQAGVDQGRASLAVGEAGAAAEHHLDHGDHDQGEDEGEGARANQPALYPRFHGLTSSGTVSGCSRSSAAR